VHHQVGVGQATVVVEATKVDALAVAMGTSHGAYKFTRKPDGAVLAMPQVGFISPPYWLMMSCRSCGTEDEPCITRWVLGRR
jgi:fructose/tagatose bisphosphate aldolase